LHGGHHFFAKAEKRGLEFWKVFQEKKSFKKADHIIAVSRYVAESTRNLLNLKNREIEVIHNPIDSKKFYKCDIDKIKKHSIFFAGSIIEKKGIRQLIQSLDYLVDEFSDVHLYIAGRDAKLPGTNIQYRPILENFINDKIRSHITFLGVVSNIEIMNYIESSEICCYPSHMEAMPLAWLEVLAMGKSFIGSKTGPGPEVVKENITGLLVNPFEPKEIADKIRFLFNNPKVGVEMGTLARERIIKEFDIEVIVNQNINFFYRCLEKK
jgi:glycosyltransferase involved in cell wall biosynthesis